METRNELTVALLQISLVWQDAAANLAVIEEHLKNLDPKVNLVVLPEMFNSGFTMNTDAVAEEMSGHSVSWLLQKSKEYQIGICGSLVIREMGRNYNRFVLVRNGVLVSTYDKKHLFRMADEHLTFTAGDDDGRIQYEGWNILMRVCYDLRFPVWSRTNDVDLQIYVANWPSVRVDAWSKLLMARAIENQCYILGVNRIGQDGNGKDYSGHSIAIDPKGKALSPESNSKAGWIVAKLNRPELVEFRAKFPLNLDADSFTMN